MPAFFLRQKIKKHRETPVLFFNNRLYQLTII